MVGFYQAGGGEFWVARHDGSVVGTIAAIDRGNEHRFYEKHGYVLIDAGSSRQASRRERCDGIRLNQFDNTIVRRAERQCAVRATLLVRSFEAGPEGVDVTCIGARKSKGGDTARFENFWN